MSERITRTEAEGDPSDCNIQRSQIAVDPVFQNMLNFDLGEFNSTIPSKKHCGVIKLLGKEFQCIFSLL